MRKCLYILPCFFLCLQPCRSVQQMMSTFCLTIFSRAPCCSTESRLVYWVKMLSAVTTCLASVSVWACKKASCSFFNSFKTASSSLKGPSSLFFFSYLTIDVTTLSQFFWAALRFSWAASKCPHGSIPPEAKHFFTDTYLFCLHKDKTEKRKLHPIGIPTAIQQIISRNIA